MVNNSEIKTEILAHSVEDASGSFCFLQKWIKFVQRVRYPIVAKVLSPISSPRLILVQYMFIVLFIPPKDGNEVHVIYIKKIGPFKQLYVA